MEGGKLCGICFTEAINIKQHLLRMHKVANLEELHLLQKYGSARTTAVLDCPCCVKKGVVRLDKHLQNLHNKTSSDERAALLREAKRFAIIKELRDLRLSDPSVPLVSELDLGTSYHMDQERPGPSRVDYEARIQRLEARLTSLERSHALLQKKCRSLQVAPAPVAPTSAQKGEHVDKH
uniref:C2H2-type domain-containing protein n=1 Tax=Knipowitschia caucasica TaxID=637954 RepID=A0AAV2KN99_KNICA